MKLLLQLQTGQVAVVQRPRYIEAVILFRRCPTYSISWSVGTVWSRLVWFFVRFFLTTDNALESLPFFFLFSIFFFFFFFFFFRTLFCNIFIFSFFHFFGYLFVSLYMNIQVSIYR